MTTSTHRLRGDLLTVLPLPLTLLAPVLAAALLG
jgi:hypothetical protein